MEIACAQVSAAANSDAEAGVLVAPAQAVMSAGAPQIACAGNKQKGQEERAQQGGPAFVWQEDVAGKIDGATSGENRRFAIKVGKIVRQGHQRRISIL